MSGTIESFVTWELGTLLVPVTSQVAARPLGAASFNRMVPFRLTVSVDTSTIERNEQGEITFAYLSFLGRYESRHWNDEVLGLPYGDDAVVAAINAYLAGQGIGAVVGWSESGRQDDGLADFDCDYSIVDTLWPVLAGEKPVRTGIRR